jgi:hypothetical protein
MKESMKNTTLTIRRTAFTVMTAGLLASGMAIAEDKENLKIEFPEALFQGTPVPPGNLKNLEKVGDPVKTIAAAKGSVIISKDKPVTSSDSAPSIGEHTIISDQDKTGEDGSFLELGPGPQWTQIDLGADHNISAVVLWHYLKQARVYKGVVVEVSTDAEMKNSTILFNNDIDNTVGKGAGKDNCYVETNHGRIIDGKATKARYIRTWSNGNHIDDLNHYVEVEVWGVPVK